MDYYSIKMRAEKARKNEFERNKHISGAERIVEKSRIEQICSAMVCRALTHTKGSPDNINIKIEKIDAQNIEILDALPVTRIDVKSAEEGLQKAFEILDKSVKGLKEKFASLLKETYSMRGAMLYDIRTNTRLEPDKERGVRATYMDALNSNEITGKDHFNEALVLSTKVAFAPGIVGEICISDDPDYVTGYVSNKNIGYVRIMKMKNLGDENGGRIFLFDSNLADVNDCIQYLQSKKVLVKIP